MTLTFDLLTWILTGIIHSSRTIYIPSLKLLGQSFLELSVAQSDNMWETDMTYDLDLYSSRTIYIPSVKLLGQSVPELSVAQIMGNQHVLWTWPLDLLTWKSIGIIYLSWTIYLPSFKFLQEACRTKHCWFISCTRNRRSTWRPMTLTFDLLTWIYIGTIYSSRTIYLPSLKLLRQRVSELTVAQGMGNQHDLWPWPTDLKINRYHLLIVDYPPTKFEACRIKHCWDICCTSYRRSTWPLTYWPEYQ